MLSYLVYANFAYGKKVRSSLSEFKERNGFQKMDVPRYYVPLTWRGASAYRLGLHRRLADQIPDRWSRKCANLRNGWNKRRLQLESGVFLETALPGIVGLITKLPHAQAPSNTCSHGASPAA